MVVQKDGRACAPGELSQFKVLYQNPIDWVTYTTGIQSAESGRSRSRVLAWSGS